MLELPRLDEKLIDHCRKEVWEAQEYSAVTQGVTQGHVTQGQIFNLDKRMCYGKRVGPMFSVMDKKLL
jgi:hypothetical protein